MTLVQPHSVFDMVQRQGKSTPISEFAMHFPAGATPVPIFSVYRLHTYVNLKQRAAASLLCRYM